MDFDIATECRSAYVTGSPQIAPADERAFARLKEYVARGNHAPEHRKVAFALDVAGGRFFRAQLHNRRLRDAVYYAKHFARPVHSSRVLCRKLMKRMGLAASG
jgi:hypothetical protein